MDEGTCAAPALSRTVSAEGDQAPRQGRHPERSASPIYRMTQLLVARSRRTPAMLVGRCSCELSGRELQRKPRNTAGCLTPRLAFANLAQMTEPRRPFYVSS